MLLTGRNAVVYGGGGRIGSAVAEAFARAGATVHLAGHHAGPLETVAARIRADGGSVRTAVVDALDESAVDAHAEAVVAGSGSLDISFNLIAQGDVQGTPLVELSLADLEHPVLRSTRTFFLTARAAARHMIRQRRGVILTFGGYGDPSPNLGGLQVAFGAVEAMRRAWACELGRYGIRVLTLQTGGIVETMGDFDGRDAIAAAIEGRTMLGRAASLADVGNVAVFAASELAASMTGTALNITAGSVVD